MSTGNRNQRIGKYEILGHIATGGMGAVYKAIDTELQRPVALKVLPSETAARPNMLKRFQNEAKSAAKLRHENIVAVYECSQVKGTHFLAMEFVDGKDLHALVSKGRLQPEAAAQIVLQAARALDHAHRNHIIHRDIKPSNLMITHKDGHVLVKLADFGLARQVTDDTFQITRAGTTVGTVDYMSPEQARNSQVADIRSDIYSLGCTFYHMLAGKPPFAEGTLPERLLQHMEQEPPDIRPLQPTISDGLVMILRRMLAKKPEDRYQTPADLIKDLEHPEQLQVHRSRDEQLKGLVELAAEVVPARKKHAQPANAESAGATTGWGDRPALVRHQREPANEETPPAPPADGKRKPPWLPIAAGAGAVALAAVLFIWLNSGSSSSPGSDKKQAADQGSVAKKKETPKLKEEAAAGELVGPLEPAYPRLVKPASFDLATWSNKVFGPFKEFPKAPADAAVARVSRLPGLGQFASIGDALAQTEGPVIIEIQDNGPFFEASAPPISGRKVIIRASSGFRPLLAWDLPEKAGRAPAFLSVKVGSLVLEDIDVAVHWNDAASEPPALCHMENSDFQARRCTFSIAGAHPHGVRVVQVAASLSKPALVRLSQCLVRGGDMIAVHASESRADVLCDRTLIVGARQALLEGEGAGGLTVRLVRSTLVGGEELCNCLHAADNKPRIPELKCLAWDSLIARPGGATDGSMVHLDGRASGMSWRAVNCVYAGWTGLLEASDTTIAADDIDAWRRLFGYREGDATATAWPVKMLGTPETVAGENFATFGSPVCYAASGGSGLLGFSPGALPREPEEWLARTYGRSALPAPALAKEDEQTSIPDAGDGLYHGERIDLGKADPGAVLEKRLAASKAASRVVLRLAGTGRHLLGPIEVKGIERLVLFCEPVKDGDAPLTLAPKPRLPKSQQALIDVENGSLEIIGGRFMADDKSELKRLIRVRGGDLVLRRCRLQGPTALGGDGLPTLLEHDSATAAASGPREAAKVLCHDCVLVSAGRILDMHGGGLLSFKNCLMVAADDSIVLDAGASGSYRAWLDRSTFAFRKNFLTVRGHAENKSSRVIHMLATRNYFLDPLAEDESASTVFRFPSAALVAGQVLWQGEKNAFDNRRLQAFFAAGEAPTRTKQNFQEWLRLWGGPNERDYKLVSPPKIAAKFSLDPLPVDLLAYPQAGAIEGPPARGADFVRLGLLKKK